MNLADGGLLVIAGVLAGLAGAGAGLASLISYPALLLVGLPPVAANVTNTVAITLNGAGAIVSSRPELEDQGHRLRRFGVMALLGGAAGSALLLTTPASAFER
ncbi:MAG TPA: TSUP family transporter, partial [Actinomycetales bacterium]|nr:TSUP family transporter [Actinomycetales bacterium]